MAFCCKPVAKSSSYCDNMWQPTKSGPGNRLPLPEKARDAERQRAQIKLEKLAFSDPVSLTMRASFLLHYTPECGSAKVYWRDGRTHDAIGDACADGSRVTIGSNAEYGKHKRCSRGETGRLQIHCTYWRCWSLLLTVHDVEQAPTGNNYSAPVPEPSGTTGLRSATTGMFGFPAVGTFDAAAPAGVGPPRLSRKSGHAVDIEYYAHACARAKPCTAMRKQSGRSENTSEPRFVCRRLMRRRKSRKLSFMKNWFVMGVSTPRMREMGFDCRRNENDGITAACGEICWHLDGFNAKKRQKFIAKANRVLIDCGGISIRYSSLVRLPVETCYTMSLTPRRTRRYAVMN